MRSAEVCPTTLHSVSLAGRFFAEQTISPRLKKGDLTERDDTLVSLSLRDALSHTVQVVPLFWYYSFEKETFIIMTDEVVDEEIAKRNGGLMKGEATSTQPGMVVVKGDEYVQHDAPARRSHICW